MIMGCMLANAQSTSPQTFEITPQNLRSALTEFARQSGTEILYSPDIVSGKRSPGVRGRLDPISALSRLLSDSGLTFTTTPQGAILLQPATQSAAKMQTIALVQGSVGPSTETASPPPASSDDSTNTAQTVRLEEVIVTGSHIRGAQDVTAPSLTITREDIDAGGYTTIQDLFRELPQNFAEFTPSAAYGHGVSRAAAQNTTDRASGIDLRGLGTQSTLVLLNGKRRAGSAAGRAVDISAIPVSVIERVEVVTGGRSATYGSDAVGGVVNFITRKSLDGMESGASYGLSDAGGEYFGLNHSAGIEAERGGLVVAYDYRHEQPLKALDTGHATSSWLPYGYRVSRLDLQPRADRHSGFIAGQYSFSDRFEFYADGLFSRKETESVGVQLYSGAESDSVSRSAFEADDYSLSAGVRAGVGGDWILDIAGTYALVDTLANDAANMDYGFFAAAYEYALTTEVATTTGSMVADGQLFTSNLMSARAAVGVEHREEELKYRVASTGVTQAIGGERRVDAVFAELLLDLLPDAGIGSLQVTLAGRYDDYSDFGSSFTPQAGISWQPARDWRVRGAYSSAFRAPAFFEYVGSANTGRLLSVSDPAIGDDLRTVLVWGGSNPAIRPEEADTWSVGLDFSPEYLPGLQLSISYYDVEYTGRVDSPYFGGVEEELILQREARYPGLIDRKPTEQRIATILESLEGRPVFNESGTAWDPATQSLLEAIPDLAVFDRRIANLARENVSGLDLSGSFAMNTSLGRVTTSVNAAYTLHHTRNITATSPAIEMLDEPGKPVNLRARASFGWAKDALAANLHVNYVDEYRNPYRTPTGRISSWTTADLTLRYSPQAVDARWWSGLDASFSISNMFDRDPPTFRDDPVNGLLYDPANADARGRFVSLQLRKRW